MTKDTVKNRLAYFIRSKGLSQSKFQEDLGLSNGYVNSIRKSIGPEVLLKINEHYPELNRDWLLYGEGEMLKPESTQKDDDEGSNYCLVPLINIDSVGGIHSQNELDTSEQYVIRNVPFSEAREGDVAIIQTGNSMSPTIPPGSILLLRQVVDWREYLGYGNVFVLWLKDNRRITKQVLKYGPDPKNYITCHSYNPEAEDEELPKSFIRGVWKVIKYQVDFGW